MLEVTQDIKFKVSLPILQSSRIQSGGKFNVVTF